MSFYNLSRSVIFLTFIVEVGEPVPLNHVTGDGRAGVPALEADVGPAKVEVVEVEHVVQLHVDLLQDREHLLVDWVELVRAKLRYNLVECK